MADPVSLAAISGTLELVNKSVELVRNLRKKGDDELTAAEMRNTLIDLLDDLVEVKSEFVGLKAVLLNKEEEIQELKARLEGKQNLKYDGRLYWKDGDETAFCPICKENEDKLIHMNYYAGNRDYSPSWICKVCRNEFNV
ncbi:TPA: hypothetical protein SML68_003024 [Serratia marcescens]|uniref:hypothetical protein n=1 Tax=Serratia marcescens TaxID=615 RepID=UPI00117DB038|nr:hypothetical protein [Serratia marcescens]TSB28457.1 hypothetical protein FOT43_11005 [Serratia marcescens]TXE42213.1 hypothetical protein FOT60_13220 [Serratia marcescens]HEJ9066945.1 hypothetical protein [Serratia marcescens]HEJ9107068.1 hypothetical protein [Serratia marcescens]